METMTRKRTPIITVRRERAARMLGISPRTLQDLTKAGDIPCIRRTGVVLYSPEALRAWAIQESKASKMEGV